MTNNHDYNTPAEGTSDWHVPLNENFTQIDKDVEIRDKDSSKGSYEPKDGAKFLAYDTGGVYMGNGSSWNQIGTINAGSGRSAPRAGAIVYQTGGETVAEGPNGVIASGAPVSTIEEAISAQDHVRIFGDYTIWNEITVTENYKHIDASGANFKAGGDHKLWHFDEADYGNYEFGVLDLGSSGRVALDLHGSWKCRVRCQLRSIPGGTFTEDDGNGSGTYDRCGLRIKGKSGPNHSAGAFWNEVHVTSVAGKQHTGGIGIKTTTTSPDAGGDGKQPGNSNTFIAPQINDYHVGIDFNPGNGNLVLAGDFANGVNGIRVRKGQWDAHNCFVGKTWLEHCDDTAIDIEDVGGTETMFLGDISMHGSSTGINNSNRVMWPNYHGNGEQEYHLAGMGLCDHKEGNTSANPASQSPDGWLEISQNGSTKYVPYYS